MDWKKRARMLPDWLACLPVFYRFPHKDRFGPVSVEHVFRCARIIGRSTLPGRPDLQPLTVHMLHNEHQTSPDWKSLDDAVVHVQDPDTLQQYGAEDAPLYVRILNQRDDWVQLRAMYVLSGRREPWCCGLMHKTRWLDVHALNIELRRNLSGVWSLFRIVDPESGGACDGIDLHKHHGSGRPLLYMDPTSHHWTWLPTCTGARLVWRPVVQWVDPVHDSWAKLPLFQGFWL